MRDCVLKEHHKAERSGPSPPSPNELLFILPNKGLCPYVLEARFFLSSLVYCIENFFFLSLLTDLKAVIKKEEACLRLLLHMMNRSGGRRSGVGPKRPDGTINCGNTSSSSCRVRCRFYSCIAIALSSTTCPHSLHP